MWNVRMQASKRDDSRRRVVRDSQQQREQHVSGAEGIYDDPEVPGIVREFSLRALHHPRGRPDRIVITVEQIGEEARRSPLLPVTTLTCASPGEARQIIRNALSASGISERAIRNAFRLLHSKETMRGASLVLMESGHRCEPDRERGVRVSRLGLERSSRAGLARKLSSAGINTTTVREALTLASKVAGHPGVRAEVCISDDPDYTTGYLASKEQGYVRIPHIKQYGETHGGRVFFIREDTDIPSLIDYLERLPVMVCLSA